MGTENFLRFPKKKPHITISYYITLHYHITIHYYNQNMRNTINFVDLSTNCLIHSGMHAHLTDENVYYAKHKCYPLIVGYLPGQQKLQECLWPLV